MSIFADVLGYGAIPLIGTGLIAGAVASAIYIPVIGKYVAAALVATAAATFAYDAGFNERATLDKSAALRDQIAVQNADIQELQRQADASASIAETAKKAETAAEATAADNQKKVEAYAAELAKKPDTACSLSGSDVKRLQSIRSGSKRASAPTPPARPAELRNSGSNPVSQAGK